MYLLEDIISALPLPPPTLLRGGGGEIKQNT